MTEKNFNEVASEWRALYRQGQTALDRGDTAGAIDSFNHVLAAEPGLVACRESLREAQLLRAQKNNGFLRHTVEEVREIPKLVEAEFYLHTKPLKAIQIAERVLDHAADSVVAHNILARAALKANMPRTALLSLNFICSHTAERLALSLRLADALARAGQTEEALSLCGRLQKDYPRSKRVLRALGSLAKAAFDEHTFEMSRPATPRWGYKAPAANYGLGKSWGSRRNSPAAKYAEPVTYG